MKNKKFSLSALFAKDKFVLAFSFAAALVIWLIVAINVSPLTERVVKNVKVTIQMSTPSQLGLTVFGDAEFNVDVTVEGKKYLVSTSALTADDIIVTAQTTLVDSAGKSTLQLKAEPAVDNGEFEIKSISQSTVEVYFDTEKTQQFSITPQVVYSGDGAQTPDGYKTGDPIMSSTTVSLTGAATEINKIKSVIARITIDEPLTANKTLNADLIYLDEGGNSSINYVSSELTSVLTVTVPVYKLMHLPAVITYKNTPAYYSTAPLSYTVTPAEDDFYVPADQANTMSQVVVASIDFKDISVSNSTYLYPSNKISDVIYAGTSSEFSVSFDMSSFTQRTFVVPVANISFINNTANAAVTAAGIDRVVTLIGPPSVIDALSNDDLYAEVDLLSVHLDKGVNTLAARIHTNNTQCWAYGSYTCSVNY